MNHNTIKLRKSFINDWIDTLTLNLGGNSILLGFIIRLVLFFIVASLDMGRFWERTPALALGITLLIFCLDAGFTIAALMAARFQHAKKTVFAVIFFSLSIIGLLFICYRLYEFAHYIYPMEQHTQVISAATINDTFSNDPNLEDRYSLISILWISAILAYIFTEGGAYMIYNFETVSEDVSETSETVSGETALKQPFQHYFDFLQTHMPNKLTAKEPADKVQKLGEDKYEIEGFTGKEIVNYEKIESRARTQKSRADRFFQDNELEKAENALMYYLYYEGIRNVIDYNNKLNPNSTWIDYPKVEGTEELNGHSLKTLFN